MHLQKLLSELMVPLYLLLMTLTLVVSAPRLKELESLVMLRQLICSPQLAVSSGDKLSKLEEVLV